MSYFLVYGELQHLIIIGNVDKSVKNSILSNFYTKFYDFK